MYILKYCKKSSVSNNIVSQEGIEKPTRLVNYIYCIKVHCPGLCGLVGWSIVLEPEGGPHAYGRQPIDVTVSLFLSLQKQ